jgi:hypothetical protein
MKVKLTGQVKWNDIGMGTWSFISDSGETYELLDPSADLTRSQGKVKVEGVIRDDIMTTSMIGPVLEVTTFEL